MRSPPLPTKAISYKAVTVCPAPISPASTLSLLKSSRFNMRFSYPIKRYSATVAGLNSI
ncbi:hypothetical protein THIOM_001003 [Candidatus Thiomargarita nelsonii]|uniref:Uncharacterized protein n=1 Tax=Candidatus Thiomargarita nelsonii TaxID=1003181 RepID=A0A176S5N7_9GAMM|nr:hypothetical protein THIOM_001003 [Candidatus Thiomargarita nelsonii]